MKKILIVSVFGDPVSDNNSRLNNIYDYLDADKVIITADFDHGQKKYREQSEFGRKIVYLHVPHYQKNLGIKRIYSHIYFALKLRHYLRALRNKPDVIYCAMPTSTAALVCGQYCNRNNVRFVIDVVDLWPDSLVAVKKMLYLFAFILWPWKYITIKAYKKADVILGESVYYAHVARAYNSQAAVYPIYLGIDSKQISRLKEQSEIILNKDKDAIWICYGGTLGNSYDFDSLLDAVKGIHGSCNYKLLFIGGGEKQEYIERKIKNLGINGIVTGIINYADYLKYLSYCDIGINIFKEQTLVVHSYKFNDYVASKLFVLNSLIGETAELIEEYDMGLNFNFGDTPLSFVLKKVCMNWTHYKTKCQNNIRLIEEKMEKEKIYKSVLSKILE